MTRRHRAPASLVLLAALGGLAACGHHDATPAGSAPHAVRVAAPATSAITDSIRATGVLAPKDEARLSFKVGGIVAAIGVEEGSAVRAGQLLAVLQQAEIGAAVEQARAAAAKAERDLARGEALYADGVAALAQVEDLRTAASVARAAARGVNFNAEHARILAPADGVVLRKLAEPHELVQAGQPVLVVGGNRRGWVVRAGLADRDVVRVRTGDAARVTFDAWPEQVFVGRISNVASAADAATGTYTVEVAVDPAGARFVAGLVAKLVVTPHDAVASLVVPLQALVEASGDEAAVFVLDTQAGIVHRVAIHIGRLGDGEIEVRDGLPPGAQVVVDGAAFLENGDRVRLVSGSAAADRHAG